MDFNKIWKSQSVPGADFQALYDKIRGYKSRRLRKLWFTNIALTLTSIFIALVGYWSNPALLTTWLGIVLAIAAMLTFLFVYNRVFPLYRSLDQHTDSRMFMENLLAVKRKEAFLQKQMMTVYFLLLSGGIALYMYEYAVRLGWIWGAVAYGVVLLWMGFNWWVLRPRQIRKEEEKVNSLITRLEEVQQQF